MFLLFLKELADVLEVTKKFMTLLRGIYAYGFEKPSAIQQRAIIPCIKGIKSTDFFVNLETSEMMFDHLSGLTK